MTACIHAVMCAFCWVGDELYTSMFLIMSPVFYFAWILYFVVNILKIHFRGDHSPTGFWRYFSAAAVFYVLTCVGIDFLYEKIDAQALAQFKQGHYCDGVVVCKDDQHMMVEGMWISKQYVMHTQGHCVKIRSPSFSFLKMDFQSPSCQ